MTVIASDKLRAYAAFKSLCLLHYASDAYAFSCSEPPCDSVCWQAYWVDQACCPKAGGAGCTTRGAPAPNNSRRNPALRL